MIALSKMQSNHICTTTGMSENTFQKSLSRTLPIILLPLRKNKRHVKFHAQIPAYHSLHEPSTTPNKDEPSIISKRAYLLAKCRR